MHAMMESSVHSNRRADLDLMYHSWPNDVTFKASTIITVDVVVVIALDLERTDVEGLNDERPR